MLNGFDVRGLLALHCGMNLDHPGHRIMLFRTRITGGRWAVWGGRLPFRRHRHQLTARQRRAQFWIELLFRCSALALVLLWSALLVLEHYSHD
jgi:hypothetical protein